MNPLSFGIKHIWNLFVIDVFSEYADSSIRNQVSIFRRQEKIFPAGYLR